MNALVATRQSRETERKVNYATDISIPIRFKKSPYFTIIKQDKHNVSEPTKWAYLETIS